MVEAPRPRALRAWASLEQEVLRRHHPFIPAAPLCVTSFCDSFPSAWPRAKRSRKRLKNPFQQLSDKCKLFLFIACGAIAGLGGYIAYASNVVSYLTNDPSACTNCHVMASYYATWSHSSHHMRATCNDCHVPHSSVFAKYWFKGMDGLYHASVFTAHAEPQAMRPRMASATVIMNNCIRCHTQLNTEFVKTGMVSYAETQQGQGKPCWSCHSQVPHTKVSSLSSAPDAVVPLPGSKTSGLARWLERLH